MTRILPTVCLAAALAVLGAGAHAAERPNLVLIVVDDLGYGELGCYGGREIPTPHIDALARQGVVCTHGYVTAPFCAASRAALLTGRYQTRFGFEFNPTGAQNSDPQIGLPAGERTLADALRGAGYATSLVGKWHLGGTAAFHPQRRGFDEFFGFLHEGHYYVPPPWDKHVTWLRRRTLPDGKTGRWTSPEGRVVWSTHLNSFEPAYDADNPILRGSQPCEVRENLTDAFTAEAEQFIERHKAQPFCLYLAYNAVHSPLQASDRYLERFAQIGDIQRRLFAGLLSHVDDGVGRITAKLAACGLDERTLVVLLSDNGGPTRELTSSNRPLRGEKGQLLEGGIRVPFIVRWTGKLPAGKTEPRLVSSLDVMATMVRQADVKPAKPLDGIDLVPLLSAPAAEPRAHYWRMGGQAALRLGDWKIYRPRAADAWELYQVSEDAGEANNRAAAEPEKVADLVDRWKRLDGTMVEPLWGGPGK